MRAIDDDEMVESLGMLERQPPGDGAAPVVPHDVRAVRAEGADEAHDVIRDHAGAIGRDPGGLAARAVAAQVGRDDAEALGQRWYLMAPLVRALRKAVEQHDEVAPVAGDGAGKLDPVRSDPLLAQT